MEPSPTPRPRPSMPAIRLLRPALAAVAVMSAVAMVIAARIGRPDLVTAGAAAFALAAVAVSLVHGWQASRWPRSPIAPLVPAFVALRQSAAFAAICYAWGAAAMQGLYLTRLTGLRWQHGWQYAAAMALLAAASVFVLRALAEPIRRGNPSGLEREFRWATSLAWAQAAVACIGLGALVFSGKLLSERADWAANRVFAALAVAVLAVMLASVAAQRRLRARAQAR